MNIELLKKLIQLAGNNTNENEANAAARRACKMMYDELMNGKPITLIVETKRRPIPSSYGPFEYTKGPPYAEQREREWRRPPPPFNEKKTSGTWEGFPPRKPKEEPKSGYEGQKKEEDYKTVHFDDEYEKGPFDPSAMNDLINDILGYKRRRK